MIESHTYQYMFHQIKFVLIVVKKNVLILSNYEKHHKQNI